MKALALILILFFRVSAMAESGTRLANCELFALSSANLIANYLGLVDAGLERQDLKKEDLQWVAEQLQPASPVRGPKSLETIYLRRGFNLVLPLLRVEDWTILQAKLHLKIGTLENRATAVEVAQEATAPIYGWIRQSFQSRGKIRQQLVTKTGNVFLCTTSGDLTEVQEVFSEKVRSFSIRSANGYEELFETSRGQVVLALRTENMLKVVDAQSGDILLDFPIAEIPAIANAMDLYAPDYHVKPYEISGKLMIAIVPMNPGRDNGPSEIPFATIDVSRQRLRATGELPRGLHYTRLKNNQIYAYGVEDKHDHMDETTWIFNISQNRKVHKALYQLEKPRLRILSPILSLDSSGHPQLYFHTDVSYHTIYQFDRNAQQMIPLPETFKVSNSQPYLRSDANQNIAVAGIEGNNGQNSAFMIQTFGDKNIRRIDFQGRNISGFQVGIIPSQKGELALLAQYPSTGLGVEFLHVLEMDNGRIESIHMRARSVEFPFFNSRNGRVYAFENSGSAETSPMRLYQIWGPTR